MFQIFCVVCMAPHLRFRSLLCQHCYDRIFPIDFKPKLRSEEGVEHIYLFDWNQKSDLAVRSLVYFLKNKPPDFFLEFTSRLDGFKSSAVAIVPGCSLKGGVNHAASLAGALLKQKLILRVLEAEVVKGSNVSQQKLKSREERLRSNRVDLKGQKSLKNWIYVDDVLVSGGTFKAVSDAMFTKPKAIFTLFYKPRLNNKGFY